MACILATTPSTSSGTLAAMFRQPVATRLNAQAIMIPIMIRAFGPLPPILSFALPANATVAVILATIIRNLRLPARVARLLRLTRLGGQNVTGNTPIASLAGPPVRNSFGQMVQQPVTLEVRMGMPGGKGGFGSQLRAAGGKMSSNRNGAENRDSCRDLNGRRLSTVKQAQQLAAYLATQDERERAMDEAQKKKFAKLERMLGRKPRGEADFVEAAQRLHDEGDHLDDGSPDAQGESDRGEGSSRAVAEPLRGNTKAAAEGKGKKRERIEDPEYVEQSRAIVDNVRSAVASAMMKKKRKAAAAAANGTAKHTSTNTAAETQSSALPPATSPAKPASAQAV